MEDCSDPQRFWFPHRTICYKTMERAASSAKYSARHEKLPYHDGTFPTDLADWSATRDAEHPIHYLDGVTIWVHDQDLAPDDNFLGG